MIIRHAKNNDCHAIYRLHIDSIQYYCSNFYTKEAIIAWVELKSPEEYQNCPAHQILIVAEEKNEITGFGLLNLIKKSIDSLYIKPNMAGKGIGKLLLKQLENIARENNVESLKLVSTLNAMEFYHHMGYKGKDKSIFKLSSGVNLDCIKMNKEFCSFNTHSDTA